MKNIHDGACNVSSRPLVIYHANCPDGFTAAWAAWLSLGDNADYLPANHGDAVPDATGREVYVLDFSWKHKDMLWLATQAKHVVVLDHHATARDELASFEHISHIITCVFDMNKSGAVLAWEHFHPGKEVPYLVQLVQDRDLWKWELLESKALNAWLSLQPREFRRWGLLSMALEAPKKREQWVVFGRKVWPEKLIYSITMQDFIRQGQAVLDYQDAVIRGHVAKAVQREIAGHNVLVCNATTLHSEIAEKLAKGRPFGAVYFDRLSDNMRIWSLRSREGGINVADIAKRFGGGGHPQAAGYQEELPR
jgi:oligoribonuclease NrnB/cAMP/cGMP phosphodiesterase (DHH superfamily)